MLLGLNGLPRSLRNPGFLQPGADLPIAEALTSLWARSSQPLRFCNHVGMQLSVCLAPLALPPFLALSLSLLRNAASVTCGTRPPLLTTSAKLSKVDVPSAADHFRVGPKADFAGLDCIASSRSVHLHEIAWLPDQKNAFCG